MFQYHLSLNNKSLNVSVSFIPKKTSPWTFQYHLSLNIKSLNVSVSFIPKKNKSLNVSVSFIPKQQAPECIEPIFLRCYEYVSTGGRLLVLSKRIFRFQFKHHFFCKWLELSLHTVIEHSFALFCKNCEQRFTYLCELNDETFLKGNWKSLREHLL